MQQGDAVVHRNDNNFVGHTFIIFTNDTSAKKVYAFEQTNPKAELTTWTYNDLAAEIICRPEKNNLFCLNSWSLIYLIVGKYGFHEFRLLSNKGEPILKKIILFLCVIFLCLTSCGRKETTLQEKEEVDGFALVLHSEYIFSCDMPETWDYYIYPRYSKSFFEYEGESDKSIGAFFSYSKTDPQAHISLVHESASSRKPFEHIGGETEDFVFADGSVGMRRLLDGEYYYKEYIYHPESKYYITLVTSKKDYLEHEEELRAFLGSIAFGYRKLPKTVSENTERPYRLHVWNEFLQAELTVKPGTAIDAIWEWEDTELIFDHLVVCPDGSDTKLVLGYGNLSGSADEEGGTWERCKFKSGLSAYRMAFTKDAQTVVEYDIIRSGCTINIYGEETEQIKEIIYSVEMK